MSDGQSKPLAPPQTAAPQSCVFGAASDQPRGPIRPPIRTPSASATREAPPRRKAAPRKRSKETPHPWHRAVTRSAKAARKRWGPLDRETAERMARTYRAVIIPRGTPGSRPDEETLRAAEMFKTGMEAYFANPKSRPMREYKHSLWQRIYRDVIPNYVHLDKLDRQDRTSKLRRNVTRLLCRRGVKFPLPIWTRAKRKALIG